MKLVVTYQSPAGCLISLCAACKEQLREDWPKDYQGQEYCSVSHGQHDGWCDRCQLEADQQAG